MNFSFRCDQGKMRRSSAQTSEPSIVFAGDTHLRIEVYICLCVMRSCTDFWRSSQHDEVLMPSKLHCKMHREASETLSNSAEDYSLSRHSPPISGEGSRALRTGARGRMLLGAGVENGDDSCVLNQHVVEPPLGTRTRGVFKSCSLVGPWAGVGATYGVVRRGASHAR